MKQAQVTNCDVDSGPSLQALIESDLPAGWGARLSRVGRKPVVAAAQQRLAGVDPDDKTAAAYLLGKLYHEHSVRFVIGQMNCGYRLYCCPQKPFVMELVNPREHRGFVLPDTFILDGNSVYSPDIASTRLRFYKSLKDVEPLHVLSVVMAFPSMETTSRLEGYKETLIRRAFKDGKEIGARRVEEGFNMASLCHSEHGRAELVDHEMQHVCDILSGTPWGRMHLMHLVAPMRNENGTIYGVEINSENALADHPIFKNLCWCAPVREGGVPRLRNWYEFSVGEMSAAQMLSELNAFAHNRLLNCELASAARILQQAIIKTKDPECIRHALMTWGEALSRSPAYRGFDIESGCEHAMTWLCESEATAVRALIDNTPEKAPRS